MQYLVIPDHDPVGYDLDPRRRKFAWGSSAEKAEHTPNNTVGHLELQERTDQFSSSGKLGSFTWIAKKLADAPSEPFDDSEEVLQSVVLIHKDPVETAINLAM